MAWKYREVQIEDDKSVGDSGTETIDLNVKDPITALILRFKVKNDGATVPDLPPERHITKVEIVDGGQTFWSLDGEMSVGASVYGLGRWPAHWYDERADVNQKISIPLLFGRYLGDEDYAFDPRKLLNPQLKVTWSDQTLYDDDYHTLGVTARVMEGLPSPTQCLMWREIEAWVTASSGEHKVDLPTDFPYRAMLMRPYLAADIPSAIWTHFKLDCDLGKFIPFDLAVSEFFDVVKQEFGPYALTKFDKFDDGGRAQGWMGQILQAIPETDAKTVLSAYSSLWNFYIQKSKDFGGTGYDDQLAQVLVTGYFPHNCILYPFGRMGEPDTWFPASGYGEIALKITEGVVSGSGSIAVQQPRTL